MPFQVRTYDDRGIILTKHDFCKFCPHYMTISKEALMWFKNNKLIQQTYKENNKMFTCRMIAEDDSGISNQCPYKLELLMLK